MKPLIGITSSIGKSGEASVADAYVKAVEKSGGIPVILPNITSEEGIEKLAATIDGLLVTGGGDIDPTLFNEEPLPGLGEITPERDAFELSIIPKMLEARKPILGICRGIQILAIAAGGDMYQDVYSQNSDRPLLQHQQHAPRSHGSHFVTVENNSLLHQIMGEERFKVNSFHHQTVRRPGNGFRVTAVASDGLVEAIECIDHPFAVGVQWHPECLLETNDAYSMKLFAAFIRGCFHTGSVPRFTKALKQES
ncbi:MAG: gamma-glutamyl-gamma-aminobutyrate hydrolase family protein [Tuberibacillus sp.]